MHELDGAWQALAAEQDYEGFDFGGEWSLFVCVIVLRVQSLADVLLHMLIILIAEEIRDHHFFGHSAYCLDELREMHLQVPFASQFVDLGLHRQVPHGQHIVAAELRLEDARLVHHCHELVGKDESLVLIWSRVFFKELVKDFVLAF